MTGWAHLASRFFDVVLARDLTADERAVVSGWLASEEEAMLFDAQRSSDRRHGLACATVVAHRLPHRRDLVRAALLHDVGKAQAGLGVVGRTAVALAEWMGLTPGGRLSDHLRHPEIGARMLTEAGCEEMVVEFAMHHHGDRPAAIDQTDWDVLRHADRGWWGSKAKP